MKLEYTTTVHIGNDYADDVPSHAVIELEIGMIRRILFLQKTCKKINVYKISEFDYTPSFKIEADDGIAGSPSGVDLRTSKPGLENWEGAIDGLVLEVETDCFRWHGYIKHTDIEVSTESISSPEFKENLSVLKHNPKNLPLLVGKKFEFDSSRAILEKRMRGVE
jgi:hypothetical protein